ncbi:MAG: tRNA (adenosine(37)-N6)-threonylcarbamoyltransferase complex ATPase subunit type 1 TsaE [bacterium]
MNKTISYSIEDTKKFAQFVLDEVFRSKKEVESAFQNDSKKEATVIILKGDLGAGKTAFTKCVGEIIGIKEEITSPTFAIEKRYNITNKSEDFGGIENLIHIDAFRLESGKEILAIDFERELKNPKNLICFEWPEMVSDIDILPQDAPIVEFEFIDENTRGLSFSPTPCE